MLTPGRRPAVMVAVSADHRDGGIGVDTPVPSTPSLGPWDLDCRADST